MGLPGPTAGTSLRHFSSLPDVLTKITLNTTVEGGDNANLRVGVPIFSPGVNTVILEAEMRVILTHQDSTDTDTPDVGLGTVLASGASATLSGTSENIAPGVTGNVDGSAEIVSVNRNLAQPVTANGVFLNIADGWANVTDPTIVITGTVWLRWRHVQFN
jgi:hypothetical protein